MRVLQKPSTNVKSFAKDLIVRRKQLAIKNHNENESNAKSLRVALKSKESFKLKHISTKKALDDTNEKVSVVKKSNTSLQKTIKMLQSQIETLQSSKSVIDAQTHETKLQIACEKTMQMELAKASHEQCCMASASEAVAKEQARVHGFAQRSEIKISSKQKEAKKKKEMRANQMKAVVGNSFSLSTVGDAGRSRSLFGNGFPSLHNLSRQDPFECPIALLPSRNMYREHLLRGGPHPAMSNFEYGSYDSQDIKCGNYGYGSYDDFSNPYYGDEYAHFLGSPDCHCQSSHGCLAKKAIGNMLEFETQ